MPNPIIATGPPPLTAAAADAALDEIDFIAAQVRGVDTIDSTGIVRQLWRQHLAYWYPQLPPPTRAWYIGAPARVEWLQTQYPLMPLPQRAMLLQQWAAELPYLLAMLDPVLAQAQAHVQAQQAHDAQTRAHILSMLAEMRQQATQTQQNEPPAAPVQDAESVAAINEIGRMQDTNIMLQNHATRMGALTMGLMSAMNRR